MARILVADFTTSVDGIGDGPDCFLAPRYTAAGVAGGAVPGEFEIYIGATDFAEASFGCICAGTYSRAFAHASDIVRRLGGRLLING